MSGGSRQGRRQLDRSLRALGKAPLGEVEISFPNKELGGAVSEDVQSAAGRCSACLSSSGERKSCHACGFVRYCNRECQTAAWPVHKLVCKVLAADREIVAAPKLAASAPLLPLATIWERMRGGGHAEAFEANAHLCVWVARCDMEESVVHGNALRQEIMASGGIVDLVSGLRAGGLRTVGAAMVLTPLILDYPEAIPPIVAAGALPPLLYAIALPSKHADFGPRSLFAAASAAAELLNRLEIESPERGLGPAIVDAGAVPALVNYLEFTTREDLQWPPRWPPRELAKVRGRAVSAFSGLFTLDLSEYNASTARACIDAGAVPPLVVALGISEVAALAAEGLLFLLHHSQNVDVAKALGLNHSSEIISIIQTHVHEKVLHGAKLLVAILSVAPECRVVAVQGGAIPPLVALLGDSSDPIVSLASITLSSLCSDPATAEAAVAAGLLEPLLTCLERSNAATQGPVATLLSTLMVVSKREARDRAVAGGAIRLLSRVLAASTDETSRTPDLPKIVGLGLRALFPPELRKEGGPRHASLLKEVLGECALPRVVAMLGRAAFLQTAAILLDIASDSPAQHAALIRSDLPRALLAALSSLREEAVVPPDGGFKGVAFSRLHADQLKLTMAHAMSTLEKLLRGPEAFVTADAAVVGSSPCVLFDALGRGGEVGGLAVRSLLALSAVGATYPAALIAAGAVPRLLAILDVNEAADGKLVKFAALVLLNLMSANDAAAEEAAAAGFDAARLERLAGLPASKKDPGTAAVAPT